MHATRRTPARRPLRLMVAGIAALSCTGAAAGGGYSEQEWGLRTALLTARMACPTVYVEGREIEFALRRLDGLGFTPFTISEVVRVRRDEARRRMEVTAFGRYTVEAVHYPGEGCVLVRAESATSTRAP